MRHVARPLAFTVGCLLASAGAAEGEPPPDEDLLEFLGSWSGEEADAELFEFLATLPEAQGEPPLSGTEDERTTDNEPR